MVHTISPLQSALEAAGSARAKDYWNLHIGEKYARQRELLRSGATREGVAKLETAESKICNKEDLKEGLKALSERIRPMPVPDMPQSVWDDIICGERTEWPLLDAATACALRKHCDDHLFPEEAMLTLGEFLSSSFSTEEIKQWISTITNGSYCIRMCRPRADLVAYLTLRFMELSMIWTGYYHLEHSAKRILQLTIEDLKHAAKEAGLADTGSKAELVVRLVEHFFSDVLVPF